MSDIVKHIEDALQGCTVETIQSLPQMEQAIALSKGMKAIRGALTERVVEDIFMPLQGTSLGFRTDKDSGGGYPSVVVRDCIIEALIRGFRPVGNEMNIIAGRAYFTKEGFDRKVNTFPGLSDLEIDFGVPAMKDGGALVPAFARWKLHGKPGELICDQTKRDDSVVDLRIPIRVNSGMGADAILGKAKRKFLARILERISGVRTPDGDLEDGAITTTGAPANGDRSHALPADDGRRMKMGRTRERQPGEDDD